MTFWWSNMLQLRWMVWALQDPAVVADGAYVAAPEAGDSISEEGGRAASWLAEVRGACT